MTTPTRFRIARRSSRQSAARHVAAALAAAVILLSSAARAEQVSTNETLGCSNFACVDTFKLKCTQASSMICLTIETGDVDDPISAPSWIATAAATAPATMLGSSKVVQLPENGGKSLCLLRPGSEGTIKALLTVSVTSSGPSPVGYTARAQCFAGNLFDGLTARKTTLAILQDQ